MMYYQLHLKQQILDLVDTSMEILKDVAALRKIWVGFLYSLLEGATVIKLLLGQAHLLEEEVLAHVGIFIEPGLYTQ